MINQFKYEPYIKELSTAVDAFNEELQGVVERVQSYRAKEAAWFYAA